MTMEGKVLKRLRFGTDDDILLLKEFISQNPLEDPGRWETIRQNILAVTNKDFKIRTLKDHVQLLLEAFSRKDRINKNRSGIEEIYTEQDQLLQEVADMCSSCEVVKTHKKQKVNKEQQIAAIGKSSREECALTFVIEDQATWEHNYHVQDVTSAAVPVEQNISFEELELPIDSGVTEPEPIPVIPPSSEQQQQQQQQQTPTRILGRVRTKRNTAAAGKGQALQYLSSKENKEYLIRTQELKLKERQLELDERRLKLEEMKMEIERGERKERLEMEKERYKQEMIERRQSANLINCQQKIIDSLINKLENYEK